MSAITSREPVCIQISEPVQAPPRLSRHEELERQFKLLGPQDRQVLQMVLDGTKSQAIANRLDVCLRTVENRRARIHNVLKAPTVAELTKVVLEYQYQLHSIKPTHDWATLPHVSKRRSGQNSSQDLPTNHERRRDQSA